MAQEQHPGTLEGHFHLHDGGELGVDHFARRLEPLDRDGATFAALASVAWSQPSRARPEQVDGASTANAGRMPDGAHRPLLPGRDVFATAEFYRDVLGFSFAQFFGDPPSFTIVERDGVRILFRQVRPPRQPVARPNPSVMAETFDVYIWVSNVDELGVELRGNGAQIVEGPIDRIYAMRELIVRDCNGYVLAFGQG